MAGVAVEPAFLIRYLLSLHFHLAAGIRYLSHTKHLHPPHISCKVHVPSKGLRGGHVVCDEGRGVGTLRHVHTDGPGGRREGVVGATGERVIPSVEIVLESVVRVASIALVQDGLRVGGRVGRDPGEDKLAGGWRSRRVNTVRPCNTT